MKFQLEQNIYNFRNYFAQVHATSFIFILLCTRQAGAFLHSMERKLPVLVARAVVASSTSTIASEDTLFNDETKLCEPSVSDGAHNACDIHITITIRVEKGNGLTVSQSPMSTQKKEYFRKR